MLKVFCPPTRSDFEGHHLRETPLQNLFGIVVMLVVGWPGYLVLNVTGPAKYRYGKRGYLSFQHIIVVKHSDIRGKNANHFSPYAEFFREEDRAGVLMSIGAWVAAVAAVAQAVRVFGKCVAACHARGSLDHICAYAY